jgi:hypothetical protein
MRDCKGKVRNGKRLAEATREIYMRYAVNATEGKVKRQEPVDPFLSKVFDDQEQTGKQH